MKPKPLVMVGRIKAGQLKLSGKPLWREALSRWPDGVVDVEIRPREETRRARASRYLFGVVYKLIAAEMGESVEDVHELMKLRHLSKTVNDFATGEEVKVAGSTAKLTISQFSAYLEAVMIDGATFLGIVFPEPTSSEEWRDARDTETRIETHVEG